MNARTTRRFFSRETEVEVDIRATAAEIWAVLVDGASWADWTPTIVRLEGAIAPGGRVRLRSSLDPKREFALTIREFVPNERLTWGDAMGQRTYALTPLRGAGVRFRMQEKIGGPFFPLFARMIPSFDESFDRFAADLKRRAESRATQGTS